MTNLSDIALITPREVLETLRTLIRTERQRLRWTQAELSRRSGVPSSTISRLEQTGLGSTDMLFKVLFALNRLDAIDSFMKECQRLADLPSTLQAPLSEKHILRIRSRKVRT